jgi:hypothetical protein
MPLLVTPLSFLSVLESGECFLLLTLGGSNLHLDLSDGSLQVRLRGLSGPDSILLGVECGLCLLGLRYGSSSLFLRRGECLVLLGLDQGSTGSVLGGSGVALLCLETGLLITLALELCTGGGFGCRSTLLCGLLFSSEAGPLCVVTCLLSLGSLLFLLFGFFPFSLLPILLRQPGGDTDLLLLLELCQGRGDGLIDGILSALELGGLGGLQSGPLLSGVVLLGESLSTLGF